LFRDITEVLIGDML